jgi:hypothetical protein
MSLGSISLSFLRYQVVGGWAKINQCDSSEIVGNRSLRAEVKCKAKARTTRSHDPVASDFPRAKRRYTTLVPHSSTSTIPK